MATARRRIGRPAARDPSAAGHARCPLPRGSHLPAAEDLTRQEAAPDQSARWPSTGRPYSFPLERGAELSNSRTMAQRMEKAQTQMGWAQRTTEKNSTSPGRVGAAP